MAVNVNEFDAFWSMPVAVSAGLSSSISDVVKVRGKNPLRFLRNDVSMKTRTIKVFITETVAFWLPKLNNHTDT